MLVNEAIILAGGKGTRLQSVVKDVPKPMAPIGELPFLAYLVQYLKTQGIEKVVMSVGYKYEQIQAFFKNYYKGVYIDYNVETEPLGTGGAIYKSLQLINRKDFFVLNGDTFFQCDFDQLREKHQTSNAYLTAALKPMTNFSRYGTVSTNDEGRITGFYEKTLCEAGLINGGVYLINKYFIAKKAVPRSFSFEKLILEEEYVNMPFYGVEQDAYFIDIGIPEDYAKAQDEIPSMKF